MPLKRMLLAGLIAAAAFSADEHPIDRLRLLNRQLARNGGEDRLRERAAVLSSLIESEPAAALSAVLPGQVRDELQSRLPAAARWLESPGEWLGKVEILARDDFDTGRSRIERRLRRGNEVLDLHLAFPGTESLASGDSLTVRGYRLGDRVLVTALLPLEPRAADSCSPVGDQKTAVLMVTFPGTLAPAITRDSLRDIFFGSSGQSLDAYWREASYGKTSASGDVFGWFTLDRAYSCDETSALRDAAIRAAESQVDFRNYGRIFIVFARPAGGCSFAGTGSIGCYSLSSPSRGSFTASVTWILGDEMIAKARGVGVAVHEGGHNLGLYHGNARDYLAEALGPLTSPGNIAYYGDPFSAMGTGVGHYNARHKASLGWLAMDKDVQTVEGSGVFTIMPMASDSTGLKALKVRRVAGTDAWMWLEFRQPLGLFDSTLPAAGFNGPLIYYQDGSNPYESHLLDFTPGSSTASADFRDGALANGQTWSDPYSPRSITVTGAGGGGAAVRVDNDPLCVTLDPGSRSHGSGPETAAISVSAAGGCQWTAQPAESWIRVTSAMSGTGNAAVNYALDANTAPTVRQGTIVIGRRSFQITQAFSNQAPSTISATPDSGSGPAADFTLLYSDPNGYEDLAVLRANINTTSGSAGACLVEYDIAAKTFRLADDSGSGWLGPVAESEAYKLENSQCKLRYSYPFR